MGRSIKKGPFVETHVLEKISKLNASGGAKKPKRTAGKKAGDSFKITSPTLGEATVTINK